ncbi:MAG: FAD-dependent oxidoreductase [Eggerthellaceae bacterium]|nr:FAD-dependent oxidoreductase [Eggerthellaceae bacterium]
MADIKTDYLVIGNSAAGVTAAQTIRKYDKDSRILIVSSEPYRAYGRPLISYLVEGKTDERNMWFKEDGFYESLKLDTLLGPEYTVVALDADAHEVRLADSRSIAYKKCLLATGSVPFTPPIEGLNENNNVYRFITLDDAKSAWDAALKAKETAEKENRNSQVVVIGAGLIGLKAAEALSYYVDEVLVLELAPRILPAVLDAQGAGILQKLLEKHGIKCMPTFSAQLLEGTDGIVHTVHLTDGSEVPADFVVAAVGVRPNSAVAVEAGAAQGRGLICDEHLMTTLADVYAAGDVVQVKDELDGAERPLALWPNAIEQGEIAGQNMAGAPDAKTFDGSFPVNAVDFFEVSLLTAGIINPLPDSGCEEQITVTEDTYTKFVTRDGFLVGYILLNRPRNAGIYTAIIDQKIPLSELDSKIFTESPVNMDFPETLRWSRLHNCYPPQLNMLGFEKYGMGK